MPSYALNCICRYTQAMEALATPGVEVALAAKKTSIGIANVFSRAGVSLARSF